MLSNRIHVKQRKKKPWSFETIQQIWISLTRHTRINRKPLTTKQKPSLCFCYSIKEDSWVPTAEELDFWARKKGEKIALINSTSNQEPLFVCELTLGNYDFFCVCTFLSVLFFCSLRFDLSQRFYLCLLL